MDYLFTLTVIVVLLLVPLTAYAIGYMKGIEDGNSE